MKITKFYYLLFFTFIYSCNTYVSELDQLVLQNTADDDNKIVHPAYLNIYTKFNTPEGYRRIKSHDKFGDFIRGLQLKPDFSRVTNFDGTEKKNKDSYVAVIDLPNPSKNIQYNENAIYRLRAEYLFQNKLYNKINFKLNKNLQSYEEFNKGDHSYPVFLNYIEYIFSSNKKNSLINDVEKINWNDMQIGDIIYQYANFKSHAVIVVDMAINKNGKKIFLLAQSFYPSQEIHILSNPNNSKISPWYENSSKTILTPEWRFMTNDLMRFAQPY